MTMTRDRGSCSIRKGREAERPDALSHHGWGPASACLWVTGRLSLHRLNSSPTGSQGQKETLASFYPVSFNNVKCKRPPESSAMIRQSIKTCQKIFEKDVIKPEDQTDSKDLFILEAVLLPDYTHF